MIEDSNSYSEYHYSQLLYHLQLRAWHTRGDHSRPHNEVDLIYVYIISKFINYIWWKNEIVLHISRARIWYCAHDLTQPISITLDANASHFFPIEHAGKIYKKRFKKWNCCSCSVHYFKLISNNGESTGMLLIPCIQILFYPPPPPSIFL